MSDTVLNVENLTMNFGGLRAVDDVSLSIKKNEIVALIGPNGAGKTTFFNCVTGVYAPTEGKIQIAPPGKSQEVINGVKPHKITEKGLARTFQNIRLFQNMTVLENIMIGRHCRLKSGILGAIFRGPAAREEEEKLVHDSYAILKKIGIERYVNELAKNLPYGAQRLLEIARALATDPFMLLLDEPAAGMNPNETRHLVDLILRLRESENVTIFLIEHDMSLVMTLSERIYVVDYGQMIAQGTPDVIKKDTRVIKAYLGEEVHA
ncbi:ABC transporter ATP-binding protein [Marispirochaeta sp.]|uniref:ABC transporter ATP-binding protein n=1 Tax=Marispirochaeta sp. TaxID=2038653 RepID=UPI0029C8A5A3|nr:ABC transporter ATP-binding protein [Marispirochaeta sp.]